MGVAPPKSPASALSLILQAPQEAFGAEGQVHLVCRIPSKQNWLLSYSYFFVSPEKARKSTSVVLLTGPLQAAWDPSYPASSVAQ